MANVTPLGDRILARRSEPEEQQSGGIIIPDTAKETPLEAEVVAVGAGKIGDDGERQEMGLEVGDRILISKYGGTEVKLDGVEHLILREDDVLAVVEG
jgi:chaperonin GroES